jgi:hypothetical protein
MDEIVSTAATNEARGKIAVNIHSLAPNAAEIRASENPEIHNVSHKYCAPAPIPTFNHALLWLSGVKRKRPAHPQNAREQAMLRQPIPFAIVLRFISGNQHIRPIDERRLIVTNLMQPRPLTAELGTNEVDQVSIQMEAQQCRTVGYLACSWFSI